MKTLFTSILIILSFYMETSGQWVLQNPLTCQTDITSVHFYDTKYGLAVSDFGYVIVTTDGGITWNGNSIQNNSPYTGLTILKDKLNSIYIVSCNQEEIYAFAVGTNGDIQRIVYNIYNEYSYGIKKTSNTNVNLHSVFFTSEQTGYCSGNSGTILKTTDGGTSWVTLNTGTTYNLHSIYFTDSNTGYAAGGQNSGYIGIILKTTDAGNSWKVQYSGISNKYLYSINFANSTTGWACGWNGTILKTTNGGKNWYSRTSGVTSHLRSICFKGLQNGNAVGTDGTVLKSDNGGAVWTKRTSNTKQQLNSVFILNDNSVTAAGNTGTIISSADGKSGWKVFPIKNLSDLKEVMFKTPYLGYIIARGLIYKTTDAGKTWIWKNFNKPTNTLIDKLFFIDSNTGWGINKNILYKTTNGGASWAKNFEYSLQYDDVHFKSIFFIDNSNGWVLGSDGGLMYIFYTNNGGKDWIKGGINQTGALEAIKVFFKDMNTGFLLASDQNTPFPVARIYNSTDGGKNWNRVPYYFLYFEHTGLNDITFIDNQKGFFIGGYYDDCIDPNCNPDEPTHEFNPGSMIISTADGGNSWVRKEYNLPWSSGGRYRFLTSVSFPTSTVGYTVGNGIYKTTDGGENWFFQNPGLICSLNSVSFTDVNNGWAVGDNGVILKHQPGALSPQVWTSRIVFENNFTAQNSDHKFMDFGQSLNATDGLDKELGETQLQSFPPEGTFDARFMLPVNPSVSSLTDFRNSYNNNVIWTINFQYEKYPSRVYWFLDEYFDEEIPGEFYLVDGIDGSYLNVNMRNITEPIVFNEKPLFNTLKIIFNRDQAGNKSAANKEKTDLTGKLIPKEFTLHQNYPNPFNPITRIKFDLPENSNVNLSVYSILGERIVELVNGEMEAGYHEIDFNAGDFSSGIYFYRIDTEKNHAVKKMLLLK